MWACLVGTAATGWTVVREERETERGREKGREKERI